MSNLSKALDLRLRGFSSKHVKNVTGVSHTVLLKYAKSMGYSKLGVNDQIKYQVEYITEHYSDEKILSTFREVWMLSDRIVACKRKEIKVLGCCFGEFSKVFRKLLGDDLYVTERNSLSSRKYKSTMLERYGVDHSMHSSDMKDKRTVTMRDLYGVDHPNQNPEILKKMQTSFNKTMLERHGVEWPTQLPEVALKVSESRQKTMLEKYGARNSVEVDSIRNSIFKSRATNGTLNSSLHEDTMHERLIELFGVNDVQRNVVVDERYPWHVDFYIESRDLFIELNGDRCHGGHWFDPNNPSDLELVALWLSKSEIGSRYTKYVDTWTGSDVDKRNRAAEVGLNYLVFWDSSVGYVNKERYAKLLDFELWVQDGLPDPKTWKSEHTY